MGKSKNPKYKIRERTRNRINQLVKYQVAIHNGECCVCSKKCDMNPKTSKPFHACSNCRKIHEIRRKKRAAMAKLANA